MALLPKDWKNFVTSIEMCKPSFEFGEGKKVFLQVGTGFFVTPDTSPPYRTAIITNRHVLRSFIDLGERVFIRMNDSPLGHHGESVREEFDLVADEQGSRWFFHPDENVDLAGFIFSRDPDWSKPFMFGPNAIAEPSTLEKLDIRETNEVYTLSFYPNLVKEQPSSIILRSGMISDFQDTENTFMIESTVYPGNSGSPVILKPLPYHLHGSDIHYGVATPSLLIGVISSYIPYRDIAVSPQTGNVRVTFEENSGLARVVRSHKVLELLEKIEPAMIPWEKAYKQMKEMENST